MPDHYDSIEAEVARGRLWRAKEMLAGRLADARYEPELFRRYAQVLADMRDDDAAGRYFLLAGETGGEGGMLARAFLARRKGRRLAQLWGSMPAAARRPARGDVPPGTIALLVAAGHGAGTVEAHLATLARATSERRRAVKRSALTLRPQTRSALVFAWVVFALLCIIVALGLLRFVDILVDIGRRIF